MRYFGSKASTLEGIERLVRTRVPRGTFCDPFGGIATVGAHFKSLGYQVFSGDMLRFAHYFQIARIEYSCAPSFQRLLEAIGMETPADVASYLNALTPRCRWFVREYALRRRFFTLPNAAQIDAIWRQIVIWRKSSLISHHEAAFLLASLINSADMVANTAGTYYAFLKKWHRKAVKDFRFDLLLPTRGLKGHSFFGDAIDLVRLREYDVLYLDPPYNDRCYAGYYHLPETLASGRWRHVHGKSGVPTRSPRSDFSSPIHAADALHELLESARFKLLVFHYSDSGIIAPQVVRNILRKYGRYQSFKLNATGYTTDSVHRDITHRVYVVHND
jgi:adenine-specific DNA-methyltransferase